MSRVMVGMESELLQQLLYLHGLEGEQDEETNARYWALYDRVLARLQGHDDEEGCRFVALWFGLSVTFALGAFTLGWLVGLCVGAGRLGW